MCLAELMSCEALWEIEFSYVRWLAEILAKLCDLWDTSFPMGLCEKATKHCTTEASKEQSWFVITLNRLLGH